MDTIRIQQQPFDAGAEIRQLIEADPSMGAVVNFVGVMRNMNEGDAVSEMMLEHYPGMTENALQKIVEEGRERWQLGSVTVIHRVGKLQPSDEIVLVAVTAAHRGEAFDGCEFIIDFLKTRAPFWKKETTTQGERWVEERESDIAALKQWNRQV
ncbi:MAG: molybdopterin synthase catalytic subunit MoaE [Gammaproteobacteria bacterium]|nr:molybdopterin synthase catalytic subunit MoaE [Gammaproteobacteria bacterium]